MRRAACETIPKKNRRLNVADQETWLRNDEAQRCVTMNTIESHLRRLAKETARIAKIAPSMTWVDDWRHGAPFPIPGMKTCEECNGDKTPYRLMPAIYIGSE